MYSILGKRRLEPRVDGIEHAASSRSVAPPGSTVCRDRHGIYCRQGFRGHDSCQTAGIVVRVTADEIWVRHEEEVDGRVVEGDIDKYKLTKFIRSNQGTCINQRPVVKYGEKVKAGDIAGGRPFNRTRGIRPGTKCCCRVHDVGRLQLRGRDFVE